MSLKHTIAVVGLLSCVNASAALKVYVMDSGNASNNATILNALNSAGHAATLGLPWWQQDGAQSLASFDAVVFLNNYNWSAAPMSAAGQTEIANYVANGGGLVTSEWFIWNLGIGRFNALGDLSPVQVTTAYNSAPSTTYTQLTPDPIVNKGLPGSFSFNLDNISGTESRFTARSGANVFYSSSNGGGSAGLGGLVGWQFGSQGGRVASFSTVVGNTEMSDPNYRQLFVNSVEWVAPIPEAETWAMMMIGVGMIGFCVHMRRYRENHVRPAKR